MLCNLTNPKMGTIDLLNHIYFYIYLRLLQSVAGVSFSNRAIEKHIYTT